MGRKVGSLGETITGLRTSTLTSSTVACSQTMRSRPGQNASVVLLSLTVSQQEYRGIDALEGLDGFNPRRWLAKRTIGALHASPSRLRLPQASLMGGI